MDNETSRNNPASDPAFPLAVHGQSGILDGLGVIAFGVMFLCFASHGLILVLSGLILVFIGFVFFLIAIPQIGKPILILTHEGFETPGFGFIPWSAVQGIDKQEFERRGIKMSPCLTYCVPDLQSFQSQFHPINRLFYNKKRIILKRINLYLRHCDIKPEVVLSLSRKLWTQSTGRDHTWSASAPENVNEAYRRLSETMARQEKLLYSMERATVEKDYAKAEAIYKQIESDMSDVKSDWKTIGDNVKKSRNILYWVSAISVLILIGILVLGIMKEG